MTLPVRPSPEEEILLERTAQQPCQKLIREVSSPYSLGEDLFGMGKVSDTPSEIMKKQIWEKLCVKHDHDKTTA